MSHADAALLLRLQPIVRQLRDLRDLREKSPGCFYLKAEAFVHFHDDAGVPVADLKRPRGGGFDRMPVATPVEQRKLLDEIKRRLARADDE